MAGPVAGGIEEPQHASRILAAADPVWRLCQQLKKIGRGHHRGPPGRVVDLQGLPGVHGRPDGQAQVPVAENRVQLIQGRRSGGKLVVKGA